MALRYGTVRVCLCVPAYKPADDYGGPVTKIALLASGLGERGHDVTIVTADFGRGRTRVPTGTRMIDGTPVRYVRRLAAYGWVSLSVGVDRAVRAARPEVVHVFGLRDGVTLAAARTARRLRVPLVVEPMGMAEPRVRHIRLKRVVDRLLRRRYGRAAVTVATSDLEAAELQDAGYPNVITRSNPVAVGLAPPDDGSKAFDVSYVGRLHAKKQLPALVASLAALTDVTAVIAGPDDDGTRAVLDALIDRHRLADRVTVRGWLEADERDALVGRSRCFVLPSVTENFGNAAAEAMALGVPVVVTRGCGIADLVEAAGAGVVITDVSELTAALAAVLGGDAAAMGRAGRAAVAALGPAEVSAAQEAIYRRALGAS